MANANLYAYVQLDPTTGKVARITPKEELTIEQQRNVKSIRFNDKGSSQPSR
jgi:hypothetical protein